MPRFNTIGLICNPNANLGDTLDVLHNYLSEKKHTLLIDRSCRNALSNPPKEFAQLPELIKCDLVIVVGGDGTLLRAARTLGHHEVPIVGINLGRLGFLVDVSPQDMLASLYDILKGNYIDEKRFLLQSRVYRGDECIAEQSSLNDVVITHHREIRMIEFSTYIDDRLINHERADGIIVATPTGSTAYSLSSGGPILHPTLEAITLVPICPHSLNHRPLVVDANSKIEIRMDSESEIKAQVAFDGQANQKLKPNDRVEISRSKTHVRILHPKTYAFSDILREKLNWGKQPTVKQL